MKPVSVLIAVIAVSFVCSACMLVDCNHGSWAPKHGWKCHDENDERGPQRDVPPEEKFDDRAMSDARGAPRTIGRAAAGSSYCGVGRFETTGATSRSKGQA